MLNVIILIVVMLIFMLLFVMRIAVMLNVIMLSVIVLNVAAPNALPFCHSYHEGILVSKASLQTVIKCHKTFFMLWNKHFWIAIDYRGCHCKGIAILEMIFYKKNSNIYLTSLKPF
jgi:hypothetical protein